MLAKFILKMLGWKVQTSMPKGINRCVMIAVPHTSNWDFLYARLAFTILKIPLRYTVKDSLFKFPFNLVAGPTGGIPIDRSPKSPGEERPSTVEAMANLFKENDDIAVMVTPEGTRSLVEEWKTGFYHVAKLAGVPIGLGFVDYKRKLAGVIDVIHPSDDMEADFRKIMKAYKDVSPKHPEKFSLDQRYI